MSKVHAPYDVMCYLCARSKKELWYTVIIGGVASMIISFKDGQYVVGSLSALTIVVLL